MKIFSLKKSKDKQFFFTLHGMNGQVLVTSETYTRKENAIKGIIRVLNACGVPLVKGGAVLEDYMDDET